MTRPSSAQATSVTIGGASFRVRSSVGDEELAVLARLVTEKLEATGAGPLDARRVILASLALAHELEVERRRRRELEAKLRARLVSAIERLDDILEAGDNVSRET